MVELREKEPRPGGLPRQFLDGVSGGLGGKGTGRGMSRASHQYGSCATSSGVMSRSAWTL